MHKKVKLDSEAAGPGSSSHINPSYKPKCSSAGVDKDVQLTHAGRVTHISL